VLNPMTVTTPMQVPSPEPSPLGLSQYPRQNQSRQTLSNASGVSGSSKYSTPRPPLISQYRESEQEISVGDLGR